MEIQRTANAGVLLRLDGVSILLDGLCEELPPYLHTPSDLVAQLLENPPDLLAFTHSHTDHYSEVLCAPYRKDDLRPVLGPESIYTGPVQIGKVSVTPVATRHLGKAEPGLKHASYIIQGSQCIWFLGDAAPTQWRTAENLPRPDVLIGPYAYANTKAAWELTCSLTGNLVLLHMPDRINDSYGLWDAVEMVTSGDQRTKIWKPGIGEWISII